MSEGRMKKKMLWIIGMILGIVLLVVLGLTIAIAVHSPGKLPADRMLDEQGINEKVWVPINGIEQGMFIRGENPENPVVLFLHGGRAARSCL